MQRLVISAALFWGSLVTAAAGQVTGDAKRGGEVYRNCAACHSLKPDVHLSGPSLAGAVGREAGTVEGFHRYSPGLNSAEFVWDHDTSNAWLADPMTMIPGTYMISGGSVTIRSGPTLSPS